MNILYLMASVITSALILISCSATNTQNSTDKSVSKNYQKLDLGLRKLILQNKAHLLDSVDDSVPQGHTLNLMISGDTERIRECVEKIGGKVNSTFQNMLTAHIPIDKALELINHEAVNKIEIGGEFELHNDTAIVLTRADMVHSGFQPLERKYKGKGVITGIIDTGIDIFHKEFRMPNDSTKSRIAYLWSQLANNGKKPFGYNYGIELNKNDIESDIKGPIKYFVDSLYDTKGHGSHVVATVAGNKGVAPESEIIMVQVDFNVENKFLSASILDAVKYIYDKADEMGMPCVINTSFGQRIGIPHDGSDTFSKTLDEMISTKSGRALVASAGNDGIENIHWGGFQLEQDSLWIYSWRSQLYFHFPTEFENSIEFKIEVDSVKYPNILKPGYKTQWRNLSSVIEYDGIINDTLFYEFSKADTACFLSYSGAKISNNHSEFEIRINEPRRVFNIYKIMFRGSGSFNSWNYRYIADPALTNGGLPTNNRYSFPDNKFSISAPAVAHNVIAVGSYVNRGQYIDIKGNPQPTYPYQKIGDLSNFSSVGPSTDLRVKPEIVAPGERVISARSFARKQNDSTKLVGDGSYLALSGTSMSSPVVAGAVALYLEKYPKANYKEIREALISSAIVDEQSLSKGKLPNPYWGFGKLDAFSLMRVTINSINDIFANDNNGSITLYPNPASNFIEIAGFSKNYLNKLVDYNSILNSNSEIKIYNTFGECVISVESSLAISQQRIDISKLPTGMYFIIFGNYTGKFAVLK